MRFRLPATCIALLCLAASAAGQGEVRDFRLTAGRNPQLGSDNPAWLSTLGQGSLSTAGTVFIKEDGGLVPLESSPDNWTAGISTESFTRISEKLSFHGKMKYSFLNELGSGGQILMSPKDNPVNFLEEDLSTAGRRKKESYSLGGALCWSFSDRLSAAAAFDYTTADRTKFRDPRFADVLMDLTLAPGVTLRLSESFTLGAGFFWRHSLEQLSANLFGTKDRDYDILVDQGAFYGFKEDFDGDQGYVSLSNARPLTDNLYGFSVQTLSGKRVRLYNELRGAWRDGFYGSRTSSSVVFCEFHGPEARYDGCLQAGSGQDRHIFRLGAGAKMLSNFTNSYKYNVVPGMTTTIEYTGQNRTLSRTDIDARLSYSLQKGIAGYRPDWIFDISASAFMRTQTTTVYPAFRKQNFSTLSARAAAERNFKSGSGCLSVGMGALFITGSGTAADDGTLASGSSKAKSFDDWLNRQFEYDTAARAGLSFHAALTLLKFKKIAPYIKISDSFTSLLSAPQYLDGKTRNVASIALGCNF